MQLTYFQDTGTCSVACGTAWWSNCRFTSVLLHYNRKSDIERSLDRPLKSLKEKKTPAKLPARVQQDFWSFKYFVYLFLQTEHLYIVWNVWKSAPHKSFPTQSLVVHEIHVLWLYTRLMNRVSYKMIILHNCILTTMISSIGPTNAQITPLLVDNQQL